MSNPGLIRQGWGGAVAERAQGPLLVRMASLTFLSSLLEKGL